ncbi:hypothetical protein CRENBAI_008004 [Crenichthys baileyi]|uniref:Uncharacterized protein n=1 Tax=Crenichthys baileyi TaxID=28760 RepID=A0AAV9S7P5_9TELE
MRQIICEIYQAPLASPSGPTAICRNTALAVRNDQSLEECLSRSITLYTLLTPLPCTQAYLFTDGSAVEEELWREGPERFIKSCWWVQTSSTHSPAPSTPTSSHPHNTARRNSKPRAPHNAVPAPAHRRNRADTIEHRAHNGALDPTPRRDRLTRQEVPGQRQALEAGVPHPAPATTLPTCTF